MADMFEVLKRDHDEVRRMLAELHIGPTALTGATGNQLDARRRLTGQLIIAESRHEAVEDKFFWPAVRRQGPEAEQLADQAVRQEQQARRALAALTELGPDAIDFEPLLTDVIAAGFEHIEFEEEQVWPLLRQAISPAQAAELGRGISGGIRAAAADPGAHIQPFLRPIQLSHPPMPATHPQTPAAHPHIQLEEGSWRRRLSS
jgi:hemerythrin-like domain-containing protein